MKPKHFLIVLTEEDVDKLLKSTIIEQNFKSHGIQILSYGQFIKENKIDSVYNHEFLLFDQKLRELDIEKTFDEVENRGRIPLKRISLDKHLLDRTKKILTESDNYLEELEQKFWVKWAKAYMVDSKRSIKKILIKHSVNENSDYLSIQSSIKKGIEKKVYLLDHGEDWEKLQKDDNNYVEPYSSWTKQYLPNYVSPQYVKYSKGFKIKGYSQGAIDVISAKFTEIILSKVIVIDERVQKAWDTYSYDSQSGIPFTYKKIYNRIGVVIPPKESINLNLQSFKEHIEGKKNVRDALIDWLHNNCPKVDHIILHIGVIEKMLSGDSNEKADIVLDFIETHIREYNSKINIIFTSGRGKPANLPNQEKFVSFSVLSEALIENVSKARLTQFINVARRLE